MMSNQATDHKYLARWLKKREFLAYYLLYRTYGSNCFNIGEAMDLLIQRYCCSRKVAHNIVKRLYRLGLLVKEDNLVYRCRDLFEVLDTYLTTYITRRCRQRGKGGA